MNLLRRLLLLAAHLGAVHLFAAGVPTEWRFSVAATGQPRVSANLAVLRREMLFHQLSLRHEMVYDGTAFFSRITIPELESYLIPREPNRFEWKRFGGTVVALTLGKPISAQSREWQLTQIDEKTFEISSSDGVEKYGFSDCRPTHAQTGEWNYRFSYTQNRCVIDRVTPAQATVCEVEQAPDGVIQALKCGSKSFVFAHNDALQLTECKDASGGTQVAAFRYENRLLSGVTVNGKQRSFAWGKVKFTEYFSLMFPLAPVVTSDGEYDYRAVMDKNGMAISYQSTDRRQHGRWVYDLSTHEIKTFEDR